MLTGEDRRRIGNAAAAIGDDDLQHLRRSVAAQPILDAPAGGVLQRITDDLRDRSGDPRLILPVEAKQRGDLAGALTRQDDVGFALDRDEEQPYAHPEPRRAGTRIATMEASSRPRRWSRKRMPAMRLG